MNANPAHAKMEAPALISSTPTSAPAPVAPKVRPHVDRPPGWGREGCGYCLMANGWMSGHRHAL